LSILPIAHILNIFLFLSGKKIDMQKTVLIPFVFTLLHSLCFAQNIGIGTTAPATQLEVQGTGGIKVTATPNAGVWIAGNFGGTPGTGGRIVMGNYFGAATIGAHNDSLTAWRTLNINPFGTTKISASANTYLGNAVFGALAGSGTSRMVIADNTGLLSSAAIPVATPSAASNGIIQTGNNMQLGGSLSQNTTINQNGYPLGFTTVYGGQVTDQSNLTFNASSDFGTVLWQSFTCATSGTLDKISFGIFATTTTASFRIYDGEGLGGALLLSRNVPISTGATPSLVDFATPGVNVMAGQKYTIAFLSVTGIDDLNAAITLNNAYAGGTTNFSSGDYYFATYVTPTNFNLFLAAPPTTGTVGILTSNPAYTLHVNGSVASTGEFYNLSDKRFKTNIRPLQNPLQKILQLNPVSFDWDPAKTNGRIMDSRNHIGLLAQDVEQIIPHAVSTAPDFMKTKSVAYGDLIPYLTEALKEQQRIMDQQQKQIDALKRLIKKNAASHHQ
jgi:Chaperone of endosialidase